MGIYGADINLCASGGDVELCVDRDVELCADGCDPLTLTGPPDIVVGSVFNASGGYGNRIFSFDSGLIDGQTGEIISISYCGPSGSRSEGIITVTDNCPGEKQSESLVVRLPGGQWRLVSYEVYCPYDWLTTCSEMYTIGAQRTVYVWGCGVQRPDEYYQENCYQYYFDPDGGPVEPPANCTPTSWSTGEVAEECYGTGIFQINYVEYQCP